MEMNATHAYLAFALTAAALIITPGPDSALVLRTAIVQDRSAAFRVAVGCCSGVLFWAVAVAYALPEIGAIPGGRLALSVGGAGYLLWLAIVPWRRAAGGENPPSDARGRVGFREGLLSNVCNPKVGAFSMSIMPAFVPSGHNVGAFMLSLAAIQGLEALLWFAVLLWVTRRFLPRPGSSHARILEGVMTVVLIVCASALLWSERNAMRF